ncbi:MAG: PAS domain-containing protein, partial [Ignavibacteriaceae bacterium]
MCYSKQDYKLLKSKFEQIEKENIIYKDLFDLSPTPMWEEDITDLIIHLQHIKSKGITNFKEFFNNSPDELNTCIKLIKIINVNRATVKLHGAKSKDELIKNLPQVFTEKSYQAFKDEIIALAIGKMEYECETNAKSFSGIIIDLKLNLKVTKRRVNDENRYFALVILDTSEDLAMLLDANGSILEINKACLNLFKAKRKDIINTSYFDLIPDDVRNIRRNFLEKAFNTGEKINFQDSAFDKIWDSTISPLSDENKKNERVVIFHKDITSQHSAIIKLTESELKYKSIFDNINISITHIDKDGFITDINKFHIDIVGEGKLSKSDYIGTNVNDRVTIQRAGINQYYRGLLKGDSFSLKNVYFPITTGGKEQYFNLTGIPIFENNNVSGAIVTAELVTEEIKNKEKIKISEQRLALALKAANISYWEYDIKND